MSQTVTFLKGDGVGKAQGWGWGVVYVLLLSSPIALPLSPDSESTSLLPSGL